ncbi:hypothetical protein [Agitococcus lubricus]|uniref:Uncharacterized protein n=1 Tax=Agitococcus lubricus TaxID=1077255 RepID=A0A2T5J0C7_9GAMM|nr:hypothetical protein [Agitococcus lubricus]PTQ89793.1 hypothetical protein C8N29_105118 [Agitococcus lubricus]
MIYQQTEEQDKSAILRRIAFVCDELGVGQVDISSKDLEYVCYKMRTGFPCKYGLEKASVFKKVAYFVALFIQHKPIKSELLAVEVGTELAKVNINALIAFDIAIRVLSRAKINRSDGKVFTGIRRISLSNHSYMDILDTLSSPNEAQITAPTHFKLLAVFFEQLVYKDNPDIQYPDDHKPAVYEVRSIVHSPSAGDDLAGT